MSDFALTTRLLVASPRLDDLNFNRSVVLVLDQSPEGSLGVVLNRSMAADVDDVMSRWAVEASKAPPASMFCGGPVSPNAVIGFARPEISPSQRDGWHSVLGLVGTIDLAVSPEDQPVPVAGVRLFAGYAGWSPGQLEDEVGEGAWLVAPARPEDIFTPEPGRLWHDVLRRQGGERALLASFPPDPSQN